MTRITRDMAAELVWTALEGSPGGLSKTELTEETGLTRNQVQNGLSRIRDLWANDRDQPIVYQGGVYKLAVNSGELTEYMGDRTAVYLKQFARLLTGVVLPGIERFGNTPELRVARTVLSRMRDDLEMIIEIVED